MTTLEEFGRATNGEVYDPDYCGGEWMCEAVPTQETLEQFVKSSENWSERTTAKHGEIAGLKFVAWTSCQAIKGQPRRKMSVIDFGEVRYAITCDLTDLI